MKFYVTGLYHTKEFNDGTLPPIEVEANDRLEALARLGATVWTEEEFQEIRAISVNEEWLEPVSRHRDRDVALSQCEAEGQKLAEYADIDPDYAVSVVVSPWFGWPSQYPDVEYANAIANAYDWLARARLLAYIRTRLKKKSS